MLTFTYTYIAIIKGRSVSLCTWTKDEMIFLKFRKKEQFWWIFHQWSLICNLVYQPEMLRHLNSLKTSMTTIKLLSFINLVNRARKGTLDIFPLVSKTSVQDNPALVTEHLETLDHNIHYFPSMITDRCYWIRNPFMPVSSGLGFTVIEEQLAFLLTALKLNLLRYFWMSKCLARTSILKFVKWALIVLIQSLW